MRPSAKAAATARAGTSSIRAATLSRVHGRAVKDGSARRDPPDRFRLFPFDRHLEARPHVAQHVQERRSRGVQEHVVDADLGVREDEGGHDQEGRARNIRGDRHFHGTESRPAPYATVRPSRSTGTPKAGRRRSV